MSFGCLHLCSPPGEEEGSVGGEILHPPPTRYVNLSFIVSSTLLDIFFYDFFCVCFASNERCSCVGSLFFSFIHSHVLHRHASSDITFSSRLRAPLRLQLDIGFSCCFGSESGGRDGHEAGRVSGGRNESIKHKPA